YFEDSNVVVIEPDLEQAIITSVEKIPDISLVLNNALNSNQEKDKDVKIKIFEIEYTITFKDDKPTVISYLDEIENRVVINLQNTNLNMFIDKTVFEVKIPINYDLIQY
ncbi:MAG: outer membrane lipoprotein chaperone LolA, partial [Campylobacteraceae bacterium]